MADLAEMGVVGAEAAIDRAAALDHLRPAADQRQQRARIGGEAAAADRGVEHVDALRTRARSSSALTVSGLAVEDTAMIDPGASAVEQSVRP